MKNPSLSSAYAYIANISVLALLLFNGTKASAQYDLLHQHTGSFPQGNAIVDDGQGNTCLAGQNNYETITLGSFTLTTNGRTGYIGKFNSNSNTWLWAKQITLVAGQTGSLSNTLSSIEDMAMDNAGNIYITGHYKGTIKFDNIQLTSTKLGAIPSLDIFVAKLNANGSFLWAKSLGSKAGWDSGRTIALDASNNVFVAGWFANRIVDCGWGDVEQKDIYLAKLNNAGTTLWQKRYASNLSPCVSSSMYGNDLSTDVSGNVCMTGIYVGTVSFGNGAALSISATGGTTDAFTVKINGSGTTQWVRSLGSNGGDAGNAIYTDASGNVYAGGGMAGNAFVTKYSSLGGHIWSVNPFPPSTEFPFSGIHRITPYSGSLLVNSSSVGFKTISMVDGSVISSDSLIGNELAGFSIRDVDIAGSGFVFSLSGGCDTVSIGNLTLTGTCGAGDIFMVRNSGGAPPAYQAESNITDPLATFQVVAENEIEVYPNPASDQLHITLPEREQETTLFIQNQFGQTIWAEKFESQRSTATISLDGQNFQSGIYYLICLSNGEVTTRRFIVEK